MTEHYDKFIDAKGLKCPQPLLLAQQGMKNLQNGQVILLEATDPGTDLDLEVWCERFDHSIIQQKFENGTFTFLLKK